MCSSLMTSGCNGLHWVHPMTHMNCATELATQRHARQCRSATVVKRVHNPFYTTVRSSRNATHFSQLIVLFFGLKILKKIKIANFLFELQKNVINKCDFFTQILFLFFCNFLQRFSLDFTLHCNDA